MSKTIGIIGGMGPLASVDLQEKIILNTKAASDKEHLHVITDCNTNIPDRTKAILEGGESPLAEMKKSAKRLEKAGAQVLLIACNTAHYYLVQLEKEVNLPFISMVDAVLKEVEKKEVKKISILSTKGVYKTGLYQKKCQERSIAYLIPEKKDRQLMMDIIYGLKAGRLQENTSRMEFFLEAERKKGVELFLLACTELPIYFSYNKIDVPLLDSTLCLALEAIRYAGGKTR
ncbi:MAG TPA: amino acid racemase [Clostridia bacterium]|nr:amino acid racemase [Clostridia bacterium]